jgi:ribonucleoside-diphosphate reductase alpha chain
MAGAFLAPIWEEIWDRKYRLRDAGGRPIDGTLGDTFWRVARAAAVPEEGGKRAAWAARFHDAIADLGFLPAGRILAGAGSDRAVTLFNCFVMGRVEDDLGAIFDAVKEAAKKTLEKAGLKPDLSEVTMKPTAENVLTGDDAARMQRLLDALEGLDDVQEVYTNAIIDQAA